MVRNEKREEKQLYEGNKTVGDFFPVKVWIENEGGDAAALDGIEFFMQKALARDDWHRYVQIDEWTNRLEIALPKKSWKAGNINTFTMPEVSHAEGKPGGVQVAAAKQKGTHRKRAVDDNAPEGTGTKPPPEGNAAKLRRSSSKDALPPNEITNHWKEACAVKALTDKALSKTSLLRRNAAGLLPWAFVVKLDEYDELAQLQKEVEDLLQTTPF